MSEHEKDWRWAGTYSSAPGSFSSVAGAVGVAGDARVAGVVGAAGAGVSPEAAMAGSEAEDSAPTGVSQEDALAGSAPAGEPVAGTSAVGVSSSGVSQEDALAASAPPVDAPPLRTPPRRSAAAQAASARASSARAERAAAVRAAEEAPVLTLRDRWKAALVDRLPPTLRGRWAFDRATGIVLAVSVLLAALLLGGWAVLRARPHEMAVARGSSTGAGGAGDGRAYPQSMPSGSEGFDTPSIGLSVPGGGLAELPAGASGTAWPGAGGPGPAGSGVVVDVEGKVAKPGVRTLPAGSRIIDALAAAGGALPGTDLTSLNQAAILVDGQQVLVGVTPPPQPDATKAGRGGKSKERAGAAGAEPVHVNTATVDDLEQLPGIGPALAQRVIDYRTEHGPFRSVEDLKQVSGFGGQRFQTIAPLLAL